MFLVAHATACLSTSAATYRMGEIAGTRQKVSWVTPLNHDFKSREQMERVVANPRDAFASYCRNGRPTKEWILPVRAIVPKPPAGIPIDEASRIRGRIYDAFKNVIGPGIFLNERPVKSASTERKQVSEMVFGLKSPERTEIEKSLRETRLHSDVTTVLIAFGEENGLLLGALNPNYFRIEQAGSAGEEKWRFTHSEGYKPEENGIMGIVWDERRFKTSTGESIWPVHPAGIFEAALLPMHFTMLVPAEVQSKHLSKASDGLPFFVRKDGTFDLSEATKDRQKIWNAYFSHAVTVEEAQTQDPDVVQFNVRFDLSLFCAYARPVEDLLTR